VYRSRTLLHFVYLPDLPLVIGEHSPANHDRALALAAELGLDIIDLFPDFEKHPSPRSLFPYEEGRHLVRTLGLHYNADGHRLVARRVSETLQKYEHRPLAASR
jgi:lysophospholipase L1-like esterase